MRRKDGVPPMKRRGVQNSPHEPNNVDRRAMMRPEVDVPPMKKRGVQKIKQPT